MRRIAIRAVLMISILISTRVNEVKSADMRASENVNSYASWMEHYNCYEDMYLCADVVVSGRIVDKSCISKNDIVFTYYVLGDVYIEKGIVGEENILICQTGGVFDNNFTPFIEGTYDFEINDSVALMLRKQNSVCNEVYYILGGYQGYYLITEEDNNVFEEWAYIFDSNIMPYAGTSSFCTWQKSSVSYSYDSTISNTNAMNQGFASWNGYANIGYYIDQSYSADVTVSQRDYGYTGWYAITYELPTGGSSTNHILGADIRYNSYGMNNLNSFQYKAIACHEAGHALGILTHIDGLTSIMQTNTTSYMNNYNTPRSYDISIIQNMYP